MSLMGPSSNIVEGTGDDDDLSITDLCFSFLGSMTSADADDDILGLETMRVPLTGVDVCFSTVFFPSAVFDLVELELRFESRKPSPPLYLNVASSRLFAESPAELILVCLAPW